MKLIRVETKGFKSFADKVILSFDGGVVGIVGPNGSGKSNINDAIKWVLGERSVKSLRGNTSDDIIFSGSKTVPSSDTAEVSLTFDNSLKRVSLPHKVFTITRRVKRGSGESFYYINGEDAKLKDIEEIAMESGISKSSLAIISQGTIQNIAQASPEDRRGIFEEAAGVSKYKSKKEEAIRKLDRTSEALDKVKAVMAELDKQRIPLKKQADKAQIFLDKKADLKEVEIGLMVDDVKFYQSKLDVLNAQLKEVVEQRKDIASQIEFTEKDLREKNADKLSLENEVMKLSQKYQDVSERLTNLEISNSQVAHRRQMIIDGQIQASNEVRLNAMREELDELSKKKAQYSLWDEKHGLDLAKHRADNATTQTQLSQMNMDFDKLKYSLMQAKTRLSILKDSDSNRGNLFRGTKVILDNKNLFPGIFGIVADLIKVDSKFISAIEAVASNQLQNIVVDKSVNAVKAVNFLKANHAGRSTFIPLDTIKPKGIAYEQQSVIRGQIGFVGIAADLIKCEPKFEILKQFLLGNIIVAQTIENAETIGRLIRNQFVVVSLEGDVIKAGGVISGGEKAKSKDILGSADQISRLEQEIPNLEKMHEQKQVEISKLRSIISEGQMLISELNLESAKIREKKQVIENQFNLLRSNYDHEAKEKFEDKHQAFESLELLESEKASVSAILKAKRESIIALNQDLANLNIEKVEFEKTLRLIIETSSTQMNEKNQADYIVSNALERLASEYDMTIESAGNSHTLNLSHDEARAIVSKLRQEIKDLGYVNVEAIEAFKEVDARYEKLSGSEEELSSAKATILSAIGEMDLIIVTRLDEIVKKVNVEMVIIFQKMFGGGTAEVRYTNPANLLETGIDVIAQPPGKTIKNLNLFSGGEKAMVAISLLFAILKSKPLPLCILDEVEAALDDANVIRFANYLQELKAQTQFMVITHRVGTMSRVDHLFGATMQTRGVTSFFSVKLADAAKLIDNHNSKIK